MASTANLCLNDNRGPFLTGGGFIAWAPATRSDDVAQYGHLQAEIARASTAEATLSTSISQLTSKEATDVSALTASLTTETTRALAAESALSQSLESEVLRATASEAALSTELSAEAARATAAESALTASVSALTSQEANDVSYLKTRLEWLYTKFFQSYIDVDPNLAQDVFQIVDNDEVPYWGPNGPNDPTPNQIILKQTPDAGDAHPISLTGLTVVSPVFPNGCATITSFRYDYSNYGSIFRAIYIDVDQQIDLSKDIGSYKILW